MGFFSPGITFLQVTNGQGLNGFEDPTVGAQLQAACNTIDQNKANFTENAERLQTQVVETKVVTEAQASETQTASYVALDQQYEEAKGSPPLNPQLPQVPCANPTIPASAFYRTIAA